MNFINPISNTNYNRPSIKGGVHFGVEKKERPKDKSYYNFYKNKYNYSENGNKIVYGQLAASLLLYAGVVFASHKPLHSALYSKIKNKAARIATSFGVAGGLFIASFLAVALVSKSILTTKTKLHPISKEEQEKKEALIKEFVVEAAKRKNATVKNINFYDFRNLKGYESVQGLFDGKIGDLILDSRLKDTDLSIEDAKPLILHELEHAKQFDKIFRTKDGIYDLNLSIVKRGNHLISSKIKNQLLNSPDKDIPAMVRADMAKDPRRYYLINPELEFQQESTAYKAIKMYNQNPNISKYDLPLIIDEEYYKMVTENKPPATEDEAKSARKYLDYLLSDKGIRQNLSTNLLDYLNNPMEQEAYKVQDDYIKTGKI